MGILFAFIALVCWGIGDFLIQKSSRKFGKWIVLFFIGVIASVALFPFVYQNIGAVLSERPVLLILIIASFVLLLTALLDFQALSDGKISVIEPIMSFEIAITAILSFLVIGERLTSPQLTLIIILIIGIILVSTKSLSHIKRIKAEKGIWLALAGAVCMGATNFLFALGAREASPLIVNWFTSVFLSLACLVYLIGKKQFNVLLADWKADKKLLVSVGIIDNAAWVFYSYSTLYIPIAVAISISESYIVLAALLGLIFNGEKLNKHQYIGLIIAIVCAVALAAITPD